MFYRTIKTTEAQHSRSVTYDIAVVPEHVFDDGHREITFDTWIPDSHHTLSQNLTIDEAVALRDALTEVIEAVS